MFKPADHPGTGAFAPDPRFVSQLLALAGAEPEEREPVDPVEQARLDGYHAGRAEALAEAEARSAAERDARAALAHSFVRLDTGQTTLLGERLRETVEALCHALIADAALDPAATARRAHAAAALLARADDDRTFRLNPEDIAAIRDTLPADWTIVPDPALERGAIRIETGSGGVEDGPGHWRRAVAEALQGC